MMDPASVCGIKLFHGQIEFQPNGGVSIYTYRNLSDHGYISENSRDELVKYLLSLEYSEEINDNV